MSINNKTKITHAGGKQTDHKDLSRRKILKYGLYGTIAGSLSPGLWLSGCTKIKPKEKPNVILISIDTLRWDHVGCYGYPKNTTPNIDAFAEKNVLFENCYVHEPNTCSSHMSMLTGLYPYTHGVEVRTSLGPATTTLTEVLKQNGFTTLGFVHNCGQLIPKCGFARGFDIYRETHFNANSHNRFTAEHLEKAGTKNSFFFYIITTSIPILLSYLMIHRRLITQCSLPIIREVSPGVTENYLQANI